MTDRHSVSDEPELISDPAELALAEARNALRQFDVGMAFLGHWLDGSRDHIPALRPSDLLTLNRFALEGINKFAGTFRNTDVRIEGSRHSPPPAHYVPELVEDFCNYINSNWKTRSAEHLAAYALWRINWIHPFTDGNGRTARIISYILLSAHLGLRLPGENTIPEQISHDKRPYYAALEAADRNFLRGTVDVSDVEKLIAGLLLKQIDSVKRPSSSPAPKNVILEKEIISPDIYTRADRKMLTHTEREPNLIEQNPVASAGIFSLLAVILTWALTYFSR
ncbi:Fic family protein [Pleomorphomonas carboxyditropha]|uniref:Fido domain-containing protein n=1 Tax=Pleomorphomonas carboxyditropha TaxID=2023338 RepID=A0A2G9WT93_9HYPH|nr:Fic family protein [Pleomorphomonas carboxyditropha]PIO97512.1 hypothetical protein CJ014_19910 [Pleomorphomonas carboxyditropha]